MAESFITRRGGDMSSFLNFTIVGGTTQPTNPEENMIWVNTDTEITTYSIGPRTSETCIEGEIWLVTGLDSSVKFSATNTFFYEVCPVGIKQYINGTWVAKTEFYVYQNNEWVEPIIYLFDNGDQFTRLTGGWTSVGYSYGALTSKAATVDSNTNTILCSSRSGSGSNYHGTLGTVNKVKISGRTKMRVTGYLDIYYNGFTNQVGIRENMGDVSSGNTKRTTITSAGYFDKTIDLTDCDGDYYIYVSTACDSFGSVQDMNLQVSLIMIT